MSDTDDYRSFAAALQDADLAVPEGLVTAAGADLSDRFAVYRNTVHVSLVDALGERHAVVSALVGAEFFTAMARSYVQQHKPRSTLLQEYAADFPDFIAHFAPAAQLPYLADVARVECFWCDAWAAADTPALSREALRRWQAEDLVGARITAHPAARILISTWPVASIWLAHQETVPDLHDLSWQPEQLLVTRPGSQVQVLQLDLGTAQFAAELLQARDIASAAQSAATRARDLDVGGALGLLLDAGMICKIGTA
jgi:hypothetical protein